NSTNSGSVNRRVAAIDFEQLQSIGTKGPRQEVFGDHHGKIPQQGIKIGCGGVAMRFSQRHPAEG
ncbi:MAG: hypothetical protein ACSLFC_04180, partial [Desulfuromonadales bacterium]